MARLLQVFISGSLAFDRIMDFPGRFRDYILGGATRTLSVSFPASEYRENFGGTAGNIAYSLALLGGKPLVLSRAGNDFDRYTDWFRQHAISLRGIEFAADDKTAIAHIITDQEGSQITAFYPGAMRRPLSRRTRDSARFRTADIMLTAPGNADDLLHFTRKAKQSGARAIFDPGQALPAFSAAALARCIRGSWMTLLNDYEYALVQKKLRWSEKQFLAATTWLTVTKGAKGSTIASLKERHVIPPARPKNTSDPTGAGDAYRAGLLFGILQGYPMPIAGRLASVVSVYTVETYGTQNHAFTSAAVKRRYRENYHQTL